MTKADQNSNVAVLGASPKEERYSFKAVKMLKEHNHNPIPVHPVGHTVDGTPGLRNLGEIDKEIDTLTMYVSAKISNGSFDEIIKLKPRRVIFNPGSENPELAEKLKSEGIEIVEACTLVMLQTGQY